MLAAFVTGFAKEASSMIDERNKEISDRALSEMEALVKKKARADAAALERRDELRKQAAELRAYNVPEQQIVGMLESGYASAAIEKLKKAQVGTGDMKRLFTPFDPEDQRLVEDYIKTATTLTGTAPKAYLDEETAFGLKTRAGTRTRERAARTVGVPLEELYKTDLPEMGITPTGTLDLSVFATEKETDAPTTKDLKNKLADMAVKNKMSVDAYIKNTEEGATLASRIAGRELLGASDNEEKARTVDQIRKLINERLDEQITPLQFKNIIYDPNIQDYKSTLPGTPEALEVQRLRRKVATEVFTNAGLLKGNKIINRNAADALNRYAVVDYDTLTLKSWRPLAGAREGAAPAPVPSPGGAERPVPPAGAKPIPRDANGKVDTSKLVAGEMYASSTGEVRIWNGTSFQPAK